MPNDYSKRLKDPRWQRKRLEVMERDNFTCRDTGATDEPLNVHHCWYAKGGPWETPSEYMLTLTEGAHERRQELESHIKREIGGIVSQLSPDELKAFSRQVLSCRYAMERNLVPGAKPAVLPLPFATYNIIKEMPYQNPE